MKSVLSQMEINWLLTKTIESSGFIGKITFVWKNKKWIPDHIRTKIFILLEKLNCEKYKWFLRLRDGNLSDIKEVNTEIICFTNKNDTEDIKKENIDFNLNLKYFNTFEELKNRADVYIISLRKATIIFQLFLNFMRKNKKSKFLFLEEYENTLTEEDFDIREEPNTDIYMYTPRKALRIAKELLSQANAKGERKHAQKKE